MEFYNLKYKKSYNDVEKQKSPMMNTK